MIAAPYEGEKRRSAVCQMQKRILVVHGPVPDVLPQHVIRDVEFSSRSAARAAGQAIAPAAEMTALMVQPDAA